MKRKHVRTRESRVTFSKKTDGCILKPGIYRLMYEQDNCAHYYATLFVHQDRTIEIYGHRLLLDRENNDGIVVERI